MFWEILLGIWSCIPSGIISGIPNEIFSEIHFGIDLSIPPVFHHKIIPEVPEFRKEVILLRFPLISSRCSFRNFSQDSYGSSCWGFFTNSSQELLPWFISGISLWNCSVIAQGLFPESPRNSLSNSFWDCFHDSFSDFLRPSLSDS